MPRHPIEPSADLEEIRDSSTRLLPNPPRSHTHLQQVAGCLQVDIGGGPGC